MKASSSINKQCGKIQFSNMDDMILKRTEFDALIVSTDSAELSKEKLRSRLTLLSGAVLEPYASNELFPYRKVEVASSYRFTMKDKRASYCVIVLLEKYHIC